MTNIKLDGMSPFYLPATQNAKALAAGDSVEIVLRVRDSDGYIVEVRTAMVASEAFRFSDASAVAAKQTRQSDRKPP